MIDPLEKSTDTRLILTNQKYTVPHARLLQPTEQKQVDYYRALRERFHDGPDYSVLDSASTTANKGSKGRANFDPFHGMPTYSRRYQKARRTMPVLEGRPFSAYYLSFLDLSRRFRVVGCWLIMVVLKFFPRELWKTIQPSYDPDTAVDGYASQMKGVSFKRGFEEDEDEDEESAKRRKGGEDDGEPREGEEDIAEDDEEKDEEEIVDDDFEDDEDEMGGDYNAEQYFDGGDDEYGDDGFADGGGGGGDEDVF